MAKQELKEKPKAKTKMEFWTSTEKENTKRFHGKPVSTLPLINSKKQKRTEKINTKLVLLKFLKYEKNTKIIHKI